MNDTREQWAVGDVYWIAGGIFAGHEADAEPFQARRTKAEAQEDARQWMFDQTPEERRHAVSYIRQFVVDALDDDGTIGAAHAID